MGIVKKVTVHLPEDLLARALEATGTGITPTIRRGLELVAASQAYERLRRSRGTFSPSQDLVELREDRQW